MEAFWTPVKKQWQKPAEPVTIQAENSSTDTVFTAKDADIHRNAVSQCAEHSWRKVNDMELACTTCPTQIIVNAETMKELYGD